MRTAECRYLNGTTTANSLCSQHLGPPPPVDKEECSNEKSCPVECKDADSFHHCPLVRDGNLCHMENLRQMCCKTCQGAS